MTAEPVIYSGGECPYGELDTPVVELCRAINTIGGGAVFTIGSCGGHPGGERPPDEWHVDFGPQLELLRNDELDEVEWLGRPTLDGWAWMEFLTYAVAELQATRNVYLNPVARDSVPELPGPYVQAGDRGVPRRPQRCPRYRAS